MSAIDKSNIFTSMVLLFDPMLKSAGILEQYMGARNRVGIGLMNRRARLYRLAESISWNLFLGSLKV